MHIDRQDPQSQTFRAKIQNATRKNCQKAPGHGQIGGQLDGPSRYDLTRKGQAARAQCIGNERPRETFKRWCAPWLVDQCGKLDLAAPGAMILRALTIKNLSGYRISASVSLGIVLGSRPMVRSMLCACSSRYCRSVRPAPSVTSKVSCGFCRESRSMMAPSSPDATASLLPMRSSPAVGSDRNPGSVTRPRNQCRSTVSRPSRASA